MSNNSGPAAERWSRLIEEFRSFGGTANNVIQRQGPLGLGLFPVDPSKPVEIRAPEHLLVASNNVDLRNGNIAIKDPTGYPEGYCEWYEQFQADFSWGADAKRTILEFETNLKSLPPEIIQLLNQFSPTDISKRFPQVEEEKELLRRFILTRQINKNGRIVLMPIIELVNHSPHHASFGMNEHDISVQGEFEGEILVRYSVCDPLYRLLQYGFNCNELHGFSMNMKTKHRGLNIVINGGVNFEPHKTIPLSAKNGSIHINKPVLAWDMKPRMPRALFNHCCKNLKGVDADELFDQIHLRNRLVIIEILRRLSSLDTTIANQLREACFNQLEALSQHLGTRDLDEEPS